MGFLAMCGLVTAEEYAKIETELATTKGELSQQKSTAEQATANLVKVADERDKFKQQVRDTCTRAENAEKERDGFKRDLFAERETTKGLRAALTTAEELVAGYKADAEAMRAKRQRDREQKAAKAEAALNQKAIADAAGAGLRVGKATGKPRAAIPAKVGKKASSTISGGRPAKKAVRT